MGRGRNMRIRGRWLPIVGAVMAVGIGAVVAYADTINADGDVVKSGNNVSYTDSANFTQLCSTRGTPVAGVVTVKYNGTGIHFDAGATLTITTALDAAGTAAGIATTAAPRRCRIRGTRPDRRSTARSRQRCQVRRRTARTGSPSTATGAAHDAHGVPVTFQTTDTYSVSVACPAVAPVISWVSNPSSANEGDLETYRFSIVDPDSTSWSFASGYPSCGSGGSLSGAPSIDSSAKTGTFTCSFPNGPATSTVSVAVSDGTRRATCSRSRSPSRTSRRS